jgi:hypothetical protein
VTTFWVWILISYSTGSYNRGTMTIVDNIATKESCEHLREAAAYHLAGARCVQVQKVAPK